jgi:hypothetical protein
MHRGITSIVHNYALQYLTIGGMSRHCAFALLMIHFAFVHFCYLSLVVVFNRFLYFVVAPNLTTKVNLFPPHCIISSATPIVLPPSTCPFSPHNIIIDVWQTRTIINIWLGKFQPHYTNSFMPLQLLALPLPLLTTNHTHHPHLRSSYHRCWPYRLLSI